MDMSMMGAQLQMSRAISGEAAASQPQGQAAQQQGASSVSFERMLVQVIGSTDANASTASQGTTSQLQAFQQAFGFVLPEVTNDEQAEEAIQALYALLGDESEALAAAFTQFPELKALLEQIVQSLEATAKAPAESKQLSMNVMLNHSELTPTAKEQLTLLQHKLAEVVQLANELQSSNTPATHTRVNHLIAELKWFAQAQERPMHVSHPSAMLQQETTAWNPMAAKAASLQTNGFNYGLNVNYQAIQQAVQQVAQAAPAADLPVLEIAQAMQLRNSASATVLPFSPTMHTALQEEGMPVADKLPVETTEAAVTNTIRTAGELQLKAEPIPMQANRFAGDMNNFVLKSMQFIQNKGVIEARITLLPEHLGQVDVKLTMQNGSLVAQFVADSVMGKEALESQLAQLRLALQSQGIHVEKLEVTQQTTAPSQHFGDQHSSAFSGQFEQRSDNKNKGYGIDQAEFEEELQSTVEVLRSVYGNSFEVTA